MSVRSKIIFVWAMFGAGIITLLSPFAGIVCAYLWRGEADQFNQQVRAFWRAGIGWALAFCLMGLALYFDIQEERATGVSNDEKPLLFSLGVLVALLTQAWFTLRAIWGMLSTPRIV